MTRPMRNYSNPHDFRCFRYEWHGLPLHILARKNEDGSVGLEWVKVLGVDFDVGDVWGTGAGGQFLPLYGALQERARVEFRPKEKAPCWA